MKKLLNALKTLATARVPMNYKRSWPLLSLLPLLLLLFGCGGTLGSGQPIPPGTPVPDELRGQWQTAIAAPTGTWDHVGINYEIPINVPDLIEVHSSTLGIAFYFFEDGRYEHVWIWETQYSYACGRILTWTEQGTVNITGTAFTFQPTQAMFRALDNCAGLAAEELAQAKTVTLTVTPEQDAAGWPLLRFGYPSGSDLVLEKCKTCD
jgi:hypothetical protein